MEVKLVVASGKQTGKEVVVACAKFLIGRGEECQLRPQSSMVSRKHCAIYVEGSSVAIEDCGSTNGTFVNDQQIHERRALVSGDRIRVGMWGLEVRFDAAVAEPKKPNAESVQKAAVHATSAPRTGDEDIDISSWLDDDDDTKAGVHSSPKGEPASGDTMAGKSLIDTTAIPAPVVPPSPAKKEEKKAAPLKAAGKSHYKPTTESSGAAADDALRQFFHRRKV
jgi:predicted component of type VI protein secretion system